MVAQAQAELAKVYDEQNGGFAYGQTKFPNPPNLVFLLGPGEIRRRGRAEDVRPHA